MTFPVVGVLFCFLSKPLFSFSSSSDWRFPHFISIFHIFFPLTVNFRFVLFLFPSPLSFEFFIETSRRITRGGPRGREDPTPVYTPTSFSHTLRPPPARFLTSASVASYVVALLPPPGIYSLSLISIDLGYW